MNWLGNNVRTVFSRRFFLKLGAGLGMWLATGPLLRSQSSAAQTVKSSATKKPHVAVVGAGAFGGWTALWLLRSGARVTLCDAWGPGNSRASSGGDSRVIRATYGPDRIYVEMVLRALELWKESQKRWQRRLYHRTGALWLVGKQDDYEKASLPLLEEAGVAFEVWTPAEAAKRYPQINLEGVEWAIHEADAGYLQARLACEAVFDAFLAEGGEYRQAQVKPGEIGGGELAGLRLTDGSELTADSYVFACGPWLPQVFPTLLGNLIRPTRQEVFYFGTPAGDQRFIEDKMPVWIDNGDLLFYGIPGNQWRGFKLADDSRGAPFDPTTGERAPTADGIAAARRYLGFRFPALKDAPLVEARVCQYENSPDQHFILDRHPQAENVWVVGGGSGHGFKHGPAMGERVAALVLGRESPDPFFALSRFSQSGRR